MILFCCKVLQQNRIVPGTVALANESGQNSAALKNITINTGSAKFNTAIEYDTDANNTAYSRVKHYINNGKAYSYAYDEAGNIKKITNPDGSWVEYEYDSLNQLKKETYFAGDGVLDVPYTSVEYAYDARGNLLSKTYSDGTIISYTYTDTTWKDRLTSYNGTAISYDTIGNPLNWINGETLTWQRGRQLASYTNNGVMSTYTYDDEGIRMSKTVGNITTTYSVVDGMLRRMTDGTNTLQFVYGNGLSSVVYNGTEYWYVFNAQGDVIGLIDANGSYVVEYTYDSWGKLLSKTGTLADTLGTINPFRYRGYIYDEETGFYYCQTRYYAPEVCRFINSDSEALVIATPESASWDKNLYAYCDNNPIVRYDIGGEFWNTIIGAVGGAIAGGISAAISGTDIGAGMICGAISGAVTGAAIDITIATGGAGLVALAAVSSVSGIGAGFSSYLNQRMNGVSNEDVDYEAVIVDGLWGVAGGVMSYGLADVGGVTCQTLDQVLSQSSSKIVQQATYDIATATVVSTGTSLCSVGTTSIRYNQSATKCPYSKDSYRYRYGGLW